MPIESLVSQLLSLSAGAERQAWLRQHRSEITLALIEALKARAEARRLRDPRRAQWIAEAALEAASFASDPLLTALALWGKGNVMLFTGDFRGSVTAYQTAEATYADRGEHLAVARLQSNRVFALTNLGRHREALALADDARRALTVAGQEESVYMAVLEMNVGVAQRQAGGYEAALAAYARGRAIFEGLGNAVQVARMDINRAKVLEKLDRFREATALLRAARATLDDEGVALDFARADLNLAHLAFRRGRYHRALTIYAQAREEFDALDNAMEVAAIDFYRSQVYLALNLFPEAHELASYAVEAFDARGMARYALQARARQAAAARGLDDVAGALELFAQARAGLEARGETLEVAFLDLQRVALLRRAGRPAAALATARAAAETLEAHGLAVRLAQARLTLADSLLDLGRVEEAAPLYAAARSVAEGRDLLPLAYRARYGMGRVAEAQADAPAAARQYAQAIAHLETICQDLRIDEFQASFMDDKLAAYEEAVRLALRRGEVEVAFDYVERAKAGALLDLLSRSLALPDHPEDPLLERLRALREAWHWHASQLEGDASAGFSDDADEASSEEPPLRAGEPALWETMQAIEHDLGEVWRQVRLRERAAQERAAQERAAQERAPQDWNIGSRRRLSLADVQARLPDDATLIVYYAARSTLWAFRIQRHAAEVVALPASFEEVEELIAAWRFDLDSLRLMLSDLSPDGLAEFEEESRELLHALYRRLIAPLGELSGPLIVVPHGALHHLPFVALHDGQAYLGERGPIRYLPGASLLQAEPAAPARRTRPLILAHSDGGRLEHALDEAQEVAASLPGALTFTEAQATEARLHAHASACNLLHLATHGAFRTDNPLFSWLRLADARLTVRDVYRLRLPRASLVTLSACETGLGDLRGGDVLGLSQGFLATGARSLVLSLWAVDDASTAALMGAFYRRLAAGQTKSAALHGAQRTVRRRHPHPFYWAGFILVGQDGRLVGCQNSNFFPVPRACYP
jgi:CHAT domain-containing protein/tetratricopeptide (TPR) repeat protein